MESGIHHRPSHVSFAEDVDIACQLRGNWDSPVEADGAHGAVDALLRQHLEEQAMRVEGCIAASETEVKKLLSLCRASEVAAGSQKSLVISKHSLLGCQESERGLAASQTMSWPASPAARDVMRSALHSGVMHKASAKLHHQTTWGPAQAQAQAYGTTQSYAELGRSGSCLDPMPEKASPPERTCTQATECTQDSDASVGRRFSLAPGMDFLEWGRESNERDWTGLQKLIHSIQFEIFWAVAILTNSIIVGVQADRTARLDTDPNWDRLIQVLMWIYSFAFLLELTLRICGDGRVFFCSPACAWNYFDLLIVLTSLVEVVFDMWVIAQGKTQGDVEAAGSHTSMRVIRILRVTRLVRIIRIVRIVRFIRALRTLVHSIIATLRSLVWALLLLVIIIYAFGVVFTQAIADHVATLDDDPGDFYSLYWGGLMKSMLTLFASVVNGLSWSEAIRPLQTAGWIWSTLFIIYICFTSLAVLNVVTGVFCQSAIEGSQHDQDMLIQEHMKHKSMYTCRIRALFNQIDEEGEGTITIKQLEQHMQNKELLAYFESLELDTSDAWTLFKLLDTGESQLIDCDDFVMGCMRLKGTAKAVHLAQLMYEQKRMRMKLGMFMKSIEATLQDMSSNVLYASDAHGLKCVPLESS